MKLHFLLLPAALLFQPLFAEEPKPAAPPPAEDAKEQKKELPDYIRFAEDEKSARLEIASKSFTLPDGVTVDLIGVVHIADVDYYKALNKRFEAYDAVLFELVGDPGDLQAKKPRKEKKERPAAGAIHFIQTSMGKYLKLHFQMGNIDYSRPNMVHADTTWEEFEAMQKARGESMMGLMMRSMRAQLSGEMDNLPVKELDTLGLLRILMSRDSAAEFKKVLAKMFDQSESLTAIIEGDKGSAILSGRNEVVVKKLKEILASGGKRKLAIFYGAAHMPGIEQTLIKDLGAKPGPEEWLAGWTMPKEEPAKK
jgi:hypothetical protein